MNFSKEYSSQIGSSFEKIIAAPKLNPVNLPEVAAIPERAASQITGFAPENNPEVWELSSKGIRLNATVGKRSGLYANENPFDHIDLINRTNPVKIDPDNPNEIGREAQRITASDVVGILGSATGRLIVTEDPRTKEKYATLITRTALTDPDALPIADITGATNRRKKLLGIAQDSNFKDNPVSWLKGHGFAVYEGKISTEPVKKPTLYKK